MSYRPQPIDTSRVALSDDILRLTEQLAHHAHEVWAAERLRLGWRLGPRRDDERREHPCLVPYAALPDSEKQLDRNAALETLKAIIALGYRIHPPDAADRGEA
jgi:ryanodine receptor 2